MFFNDFFNLDLLCKNIEAKHGMFLFNCYSNLFNYVYVIHKSFETFVYKIFRVAIYNKVCKKSDSVYNLVQLEHFWKHL